MSRPKGSKNKKTLDKFLADTKPKINPKLSEDKPKKKHRRTKSELLASGYYDKAKKEMEETEAKARKKVLDAKEKADEIRSEFVANKLKTIDEICEEQLQKAREKGYPQPDFDFRNDYFKGQSIYFIKVNELCGNKEVLELKISTVYPRIIIAYEDRGMAHTIGYDEAEMIFFNKAECDVAFKNIKAENKLMEYFQRQKQLANKKKLNGGK